MSVFLITKVRKVREVLPVFPVICQQPSVGIYTVAGGGSGGLGEGGPGTKARISYVDGLAALGPDVVFSDLFNERGRELIR